MSENKIDKKVDQTISELKGSKYARKIGKILRFIGIAVFSIFALIMIAAIIKQIGMA